MHTFQILYYLNGKSLSLQRKVFLLQVFLYFMFQPSANSLHLPLTLPHLSRTKMGSCKRGKREEKSETEDSRADNKNVKLEITKEESDWPWTQREKNLMKELRRR